MFISYGARINQVLAMRYHWNDYDNDIANKINVSVVIH